ncbi:hypothetical protein ONS95_010097 [Cadophora gregata]|uniref:uncharacterized protein n=1 Tax=Cadophora gregata TaxID=51156 RepID=UPI0026DB5BB8|nr:uncharacterized protein ONS95_010097 [Cadophora gregata]KAK0121814.1 hypothetical protein ONS95_010097 [Cadophora gregata]
MTRFFSYFNNLSSGYPANYGTTANDPRRYHHSPGLRGLYGHQMQHNYPYPRANNWTSNSNGSSRLTSIPRSSPRSSFTSGLFNVSDSTLTSIRGLTPQVAPQAGCLMDPGMVGVGRVARVVIVA